MKLLRPRLLPSLSLTIAATASGVLLALAFAPASQAYLAFVALVPITFALFRKKRSARETFHAGFVFGVVFAIGHVWWLLELVPASSITFNWLMYLALGVLAIYCGFFSGVAFWLMRIVGAASPFATLLVAPAAWTLVELIRSAGELGFSWAALGYAFVPYPIFMQGASIGGVFGLTFLAAVVNMLIAFALVVKPMRTKTLMIGTAGVVVLVAAILGTRAIEVYDADTTRTYTRVAVVQPNLDLEIKWKSEYRDSTLRLIDRMARNAAAVDPALIVFPETAAPVYIRHAARYRQALAGLATELAVPIYIGFLDGRYEGPDNELNVYNSSGLFKVNGELVQYDKVHLLPFGEAIPFAWKFRPLRKIDFGQANFHPGRRRQPIDAGFARVGPLICFESIFPDLSRHTVNDGTDLLLNITNDGWFGETPGPLQHAQMAILRAVENRRFVLRAANTGVSMVIDPVGRVMSSLGLYEEGILVEPVHRVQTLTFYTRHGDMPVIALCLALIAAGFVVARFKGYAGAR